MSAQEAAQQGESLTGDPRLDGAVQQAVEAIMAEQGPANDDVIGGVFGGGMTTNPNLGGSGQNAPMGGRLSQTEQAQGFLAENPNARLQPYVAGDEVRELSRLPTEKLVRLQELMVTLGLTSKAIPGEIDPDTRRGFQRVLATANATGERWESTIQRLEQKYNSGELEEFGLDTGDTDEPIYQEPDYATLAQQVKSVVRDTLRRDPTDEQLAQLTAELRGWDYNAFENEVARERAELGGPDVEEPPARVDPAARLQELIEERFGDEIAFNQRRQEGQQNRQLTMGAVRDIDRVIEGLGQ